MTTQASRAPSRTLVFRLAALAVLGTGIYHALAFFFPALEKAVYGAAWLPGFPPYRHLVWAGIDVVCAALLLREPRPRWLLVPYALICLRLFNSHGRNIWRLWAESGRVAYAEVGLLVGLIVIGAMLIADVRERRSEVGHDVPQRA